MPFPLSRFFSFLLIFLLSYPLLSLCVFQQALYLVSVFVLVLSALGLLREPEYTQVFLGRVEYSRQEEHELKADLSLCMCVCLPPQALIKPVCEGVCFRRLQGETRMRRLKGPRQRHNFLAWGDGRR